MLGVQSTARIDKATRLAGPSGPVLLYMANMASKIQVLKARHKLRGSPISLDDNLTPAQLKARSHALARQEVSAARAAGKKVYARYTQGEFVVYVDGHPLPLSPPEASSGRGHKRHNPSGGPE